MKNYLEQPALTIGNELIIDGRYPEAEGQGGISAAERAKTSSTVLLSALAQVYLSPGSRLYHANRGSALYRQTIDSCPSRADYYILNAKLTLILVWAVNEHNFGSEPASAQLFLEAQTVVRECNLPEAAKAPLQALVDGVRTQLKVQGTGPSFFTPRLVGKWLVEADSQSSEPYVCLPGFPASRKTGFQPEG